METKILSEDPDNGTSKNIKETRDISESENEEMNFCRAFLKSEARKKEIKKFQNKITDDNLYKPKSIQNDTSKKLNPQMMDALNISIAALTPSKIETKTKSPKKPTLKLKKFKELIIDIHSNVIKEVANSNQIKPLAKIKTTRKELLKDLRDKVNDKANAITIKRIERYKNRKGEGENEKNEENEIELISEEEFMINEHGEDKPIHQSSESESNPIPNLDGDSSEASLFESNKKDVNGHISEGSDHDHLEVESERDVGMKVEDFLELEAEESGSNVEKDVTTSLSESEIKKIEEFVDRKKIEYDTDEDNFKKELEVAEEEKKAGDEYKLLHKALVERDKNAMNMLYRSSRNQNFDDNEESEYVDEYDKDGNLVKVPRWKSKLNKRRTLKMANYKGEEDVEFKQRKEEVLENAIENLDKDLNLSDADMDILSNNSVQKTAEDYINMFKRKFDIGEIVEEKKRENTNTKGGTRSVVSFLKRPNKDKEDVKLHSNIKKIKNIIEK